MLADEARDHKAPLLQALIQVLQQKMILSFADADELDHVELSRPATLPPWWSEDINLPAPPLPVGGADQSDANQVSERCQPV